MTARRISAAVGLAIAAALVALTAGRLTSSTAATNGPALRITPKTAPAPVHTVGETFIQKSFTLSYTGGTIKIAGGPAGTAQIDVDDVLAVTVKHADGTMATWSNDFSQGCIGLSYDVAINPVDISSLFKVGVNTITFSFKDACGGSDSTWATWLTLP
jgi:hypothetical protein